MKPAPIVAELYVANNVSYGFFDRCVPHSVDTLDFDSGIERLSESVIEATACTAYRKPHIDRLRSLREIARSILRPAIGMKYAFLDERVVPGSHRQGIAHQV